MNKKQLNELLKVCANEQNDVVKLNAGSWREAIKIVLKNYLELLPKWAQEENKKEDKMPKTKKAKPAKKMVTKPVSKKK